jgi:hypothetical protein
MMFYDQAYMRQSCSIRKLVVWRLVLYSGAFFLASGVLSLATQAKLWQYFSPKDSCAQFCFRATKTGDNNERSVIADKLETENFVPCPLVNDTCRAIISNQEDVPQNVSAFLRAYSFRSPPA